MSTSTAQGLAELTLDRQPIHALIFLFQYKTLDEENWYTGSKQDHIWFANQIPEFACATVALLNIVNNVPVLDLGPQLRNFKEFTKDMDPVMRGEAIDSFDFVKRIHNSFARETDLLTADDYLKNKAEKYKKRVAAAKGRATKAAKKAAQESALSEMSPNVKVEKSTSRTRRPPTKIAESANSKASTPKSKASPEPGDGDGEFKADAKKKGVAEVKRESEDFAPRRSTRTPKPRKTNVYESEAEEPESGFHFVAFLPIQDHVWMLDGMNHHPTDLGAFGTGGNGADGGSGDWKHIAIPRLQNRMADMQGGGIQFSLMAVTHDPAVESRRELLENVKTLQAVDTKLDVLFADWRALEGAETKKEVVTGISPEHDITQPDIDAAALPKKAEQDISAQDEFMELIKYRQGIIGEQRILRISLEDAQRQQNADEEMAQGRRHDYSKFVNNWLGALAQNKVLKDMVDHQAEIERDGVA